MYEHRPIRASVMNGSLLIGYGGLVVLAGSLLACGGESDASPGGEQGAGSAGSAAVGEARDLETGAGQPGTGTQSTGSSCVRSPRLPVKALEARTIGELGTPFDPNRDSEKDRGPEAKLGRRPDLIPVSAGSGLDVLFRDTVSGAGRLVHLEPKGTEVAVTAAFDVGLLGTVMGLARDEAGIRYYATGIENDTTAPTAHRPDVVRMNGFDDSGCVRFEVDVDLARGAADPDSPQLYKAMTSSTARMAYGNGTLALVHGFQTKTGHQRGIQTQIDVATAKAVQTSSQWVSHSLDQRIIFDGGRFIDLQKGDGAPRGLNLAASFAGELADGYRLYRSVGRSVQTYTQFGGIAPVGTGEFGYLVAFSTDRATSIGDTWVAGMNLGLLRVKREFWSQSSKTGSVVDTGPGTVTHRVESQGELVDNHVRWLVDYSKDGGSAHRPRLVALGGAAGAERFVVFWERWPTPHTFEGTYAAVIDGTGALIHGPKRLGTDHISRGDDAVRMGSEAALVGGDSSERALVLNLVNASLEHRRVVVR